MLEIISLQNIYIMNFIKLKPELMRLVTNGGIWSNLTTDILKSLPIPIPPETQMYGLLENFKVSTNSVKQAKDHLDLSKVLYVKLL